MNRPLNVALVVSHPIQHFCPQYCSFAKHPDINFKAFFASSLGLDKYVDPNFKKEISWNNLRLEEFTHEFVNGRESIPSNKNLDAPNIGPALESFKPDIVIIYGYFQRLSRRVHNWAIQKRTPIAYISDSESRQSRKGWKQVAKGLWLRRYFSKIRFFLSVGDANEEFYLCHGVAREKVVRMHFPIDVRQYDKAFENRVQLRKEIRRKHGIDENRMVVSVVGKLVPWKNQDHLVDALKELESQNCQLDLLLVGSGELERAILEKSRGLTTNRVYAAGFVNADELPGYYAASDIYAHPAEREPHSIAISEAIAMGLPIVCSDRCGSHGKTDDVQEGRNGTVFQFGDKKHLAEKLSGLLVSSPNRQRMGLESRMISEGFQRKAHHGVIDELISRLRM